MLRQLNCHLSLFPPCTRLALCFLAMLIPYGAFAQRPEPSLQLINSTMGRARLSTQNGESQAKAQINLVLKATERNFEQGHLEIQQLSFALFGVEQKLLLPRTENIAKAGVVSLSVGLGKKQHLQYDREKGQLAGTVGALVHFPGLTQAVKLRLPTGENSDDFDLFQQNAKVFIQIDLDQPLEYLREEKPIQVVGQIHMHAQVEGDRDLQLLPYEIRIQESRSVFEYAWILYRYEIVRQLCLQPVRIQESAGDLNITGDGLSFGLPGAQREWRKADVVFQVRPWMTITNASLKVFSQNEATSLLSSVEIDDCIEIFFVETFAPESLWGGGATFAGGQATSQIITSDAQVPYGIDLTHLAHELGHVVNLKHPGHATASRPAGSTGTLLCPSGYLNDNPEVNSQENEENAANPLFRIRFAPAGARTDCHNSADCGPC